MNSASMKGKRNAETTDGKGRASPDIFSRWKLPGGFGKETLSRMSRARARHKKGRGAHRTGNSFLCSIILRSYAERPLRATVGANEVITKLQRFHKHHPPPALKKMNTFPIRRRYSVRRIQLEYSLSHTVIMRSRIIVYLYSLCPPRKREETMPRASSILEIFGVSVTD